jgi:L-ascorbate metabolism protein UlaG (beta-lactamase superfamily)
MRKLGLDPAQIKYIVVTHGHGDHYGGAAMLVQKYRSRVVASGVDWDMMETALEFDTPLWSKPPKRDIAVKDGDTIRLGDTTVTLYMTPGHTKGTLSPVFHVKAGGRDTVGWNRVQLRPRRAAAGLVHRLQRAPAAGGGSAIGRCLPEQPSRQ